MEQQRHRARAPSAADERWPDITDPQRPFAQTAASLPPAPVGPPGLFSELSAGVRVGEYEVEAKIGEGAMGTVYRAVHPAIGRHVAIKVMTPKLFDEPESVKRFVAEARAVAAIRHPGIVDVFGFGRLPDNRTYLVMEWLDGSSLAARMQQGLLPFEEACDMLRQIARALEAAHGKGIIHRDLKPENVFIHHIDGEKPQCKLLDFGLAKVTNKEDGLVARTRTGQMLGTPLYMSPEQCKSKGVDHRTDIYALGCMAYEMLCGKVPFDRDNIAELISAHLVIDPPRPTSIKPDLSPVLDELLLGMVAKNPDERPTLAEVRRTISSVLSRPSQPLGVISADDLTPPPGMSLGSEPFLRVPPELAASDAARASSLDQNVAHESAPGRRPLPWVAILGAVAIVAIGIALFAFLR